MDKHNSTRALDWLILLSIMHVTVVSINERSAPKFRDLERKKTNTLNDLPEVSKTSLTVLLTSA